MPPKDGGSYSMEAVMPDPDPPSVPPNPTPADGARPADVATASANGDGVRAGAGGTAGANAGAPSPASFPELVRAGQQGGPTGIELLSDVSLQVRVELGRTRMLVEDVLRLTTDSVVELDKSAGDPIDIYVNGRHVARGEVLVLNENFCIRVSEIIEPFQPDEVPEAGAGPTATLRMTPPTSQVA